MFSKQKQAQLPFGKKHFGTTMNWIIENLQRYERHQGYDVLRWPISKAQWNNSSVDHSWCPTVDEEDSIFPHFLKENCVIVSTFQATFSHEMILCLRTSKKFSHKIWLREEASLVRATCLMLQVGVQKSTAGGKNVHF